MEASKEEQRGDVVCFLVAEGAGVHEIHRRMSAVYGQHCLSLTSVNEWHRRFREGRTSAPQGDAGAGQAHQSITPDVVGRIDDLIREKRRITKEEIRIQCDGTIDQSRVSIDQTASGPHQASMQTPQSMTPAGLKKFFMRKSQEQNISPMYGDRIQTIKEEDEFDYVGKNVSAKLRSLPRDQRIFAEKLVNDILFEAELGNLNRGCALITNTEKTHCYPSVSYISPSVEMHPHATESPEMGMSSQINNTEPDHSYLPPDDKSQITH
ncbi:uncharacterized protein [Hetaerina americana]|uniref:uncharacterized protein isoform X1 n=1 Tax=Hetaerina americana TaxID=62018 RepID=UPI003A7F5A19